MVQAACAPPEKNKNGKKEKKMEERMEVLTGANDCWDC
jgi:hypothetical protein